MPCFEVGLSPKGLTQPQNKAYTFAFHGLACVTIQCVRYYISVLLWNLIYTYEVFFIHRYIPMRYSLFIGIYLWGIFIHRYMSMRYFLFIGNIPMNNFLLCNNFLCNVSSKSNSQSYSKILSLHYVTFLIFLNIKFLLLSAWHQSIEQIVQNFATFCKQNFILPAKHFFATRMFWCFINLHSS